jgi:hypothetical protein
MMDATQADFQLALAHYRMQFPDLASLGSGDIPGDWKAEYDRVASEGITATLITRLSYEGGSQEGISNFDQKALMRALLTRRAELDPTFESVAFDPAAIMPTRRLGIRVWL